MTNILKKLSVVFFINFEEGRKSVLMGRQAPGKRLAGIRNGFGGKCDEGETTLDCAIRETKEEVGLEIEKENLIYVGCIVDETMQVDFFVILSETKFTPPNDNDEFVDIRWFDLQRPEVFINEMLPHNDTLIAELNKKLDELKATGKISTGFVLDETGIDSPELKLQKSKIYKSD